MWPRTACLALLLLVACRTGAGAAAPIDALIGAAIGATAAGVSRAQGGCFATCPPGTACNPVTGTCDTLPCRGQCSPDESCVSGAFGERCVRVDPRGVRVWPPTQVAPADPPAP